MFIYGNFFGASEVILSQIFNPKIPGTDDQSIPGFQD